MEKVVLLYQTKAAKRWWGCEYLQKCKKGLYNFSLMKYNAFINKNLRSTGTRKGNENYEKTDLACESVGSLKEEGKKNGWKERKVASVTVRSLCLPDEASAKQYGLVVGTYISMEFDRSTLLFGRDEEIEWFLPTETEKIIEYIDSKVCTLK